MKKSARGFTLVELLVVVSIIAVLSVIGLVVFTSIQKSGRDARRKADIESISNALEVNIDKTNSNYPTSLSDTYFAGGNIPVDPGANAYTTTLTTSAYVVCAALETSTGNSQNSSGAKATTANAGPYHCRKQQQ